MPELLPFSAFRFGVLGNEQRGQPREEPLELPLVKTIGYFDANAKEFFYWEGGPEGDDLVWDFLTFMKKRYYKALKPIQVQAEGGSDWELKLILYSLLNHGEIDTWDLPMGGIEVTWNIRPDRGRKMLIHFQDAGVLKTWGGLRPTLKTLGFSDDFSPVLLDPGKVHMETPVTMPTAAKSVEEDCILVSMGLTYFTYKLQERFPGLVPKLTFPQFMMGIAGMYCPFNEMGDNREFASFIRKAVYGGRNEVYKRYGENVNSYDAHMMYTSCYDAPIPIGKLSWVSSREMRLDRGTLAQATVKVPEHWSIGPLPHRVNKHVTFPVGVFTGWWDMVELRMAAFLGAEVILLKQLECEEKIVLQEFGEAMYRLRHQDLALEGLWKKASNIVHGKTLQRPIFTKYSHIKDIKDLEGWMPETPDKLLWSRPLDSEKDRSKRPPAWNKPLVGMRIQAVGRVRHLKALLEASKAGDVFYCDTDSIYTTGILPTKETPLPGDLVLQGHYMRAYFIRQKLYGRVDVSGEFDHICAGFTDVNLDERDFTKMLNGSTVLHQEVEHLSSMKDVMGGTLKAIQYLISLKGSSPENRLYEGINSRPIELVGRED